MGITDLIFDKLLLWSRPGDPLTYLSKDYDIIEDKQLTVAEVLSSNTDQLDRYLILHQGGEQYYYTTVRHLRQWEREPLKISEVKPRIKRQQRLTAMLPVNGAGAEQVPEAVRVSASGLFAALPVITEEDIDQAITQSRGKRQIGPKRVALLFWAQSRNFGRPGKEIGLFIRPVWYEVLAARIQARWNWLVEKRIVDIIGLLVTLITVILPTFFFIKDTVIPFFTPPYMTGEWNVAVAPFTMVGSAPVSAKSLDAVSNVFYNHLEQQLDDLESVSGAVVQVLPPDDTKAISGATPEARAVSAEQRAREINADVVIYGTIRWADGVLQLTPEFYIQPSNYLEASELFGSHALGGPFTISGSGEDLSTQIMLNRSLARRAELLTLINQGLSLFSMFYIEDAMPVFEQANQDRLWESNAGRETIYLLIGNTASRLLKLEQAEAAYRTALEIDPEYARAQIGLAGVLSLKTVSGGKLPDETALEQAMQMYEQALTAKHQPELADIPAKVAFGKGVVWCLRGLNDLQYYDKAIPELQAVIQADQANSTPTTRELASEAYARLGLIASQRGDYAGTIQPYQQAIEMSASPERRGIYWSRLGKTYANTSQPEASRTAYDNAVSQYQLALPLTNDPAKRAELWANIAKIYQALGDQPQAASALRQALNMLAPGRPERDQYKNQLDALAVP